jgi:hypothetical protein
MAGTATVSREHISNFSPPLTNSALLDSFESAVCRVTSAYVPSYMEQQLVEELRRQILKRMTPELPTDADWYGKEY